MSCASKTPIRDASPPITRSKRQSGSTGAHQTFLKTIEDAQAYIMSGAARIPMEEEITTTFTTTELSGPVPDALFAFVPPSDAKLMQDFPDPQHDFGGANMTGDQVPSLKLKSADGKVVALD